MASEAQNISADTGRGNADRQRMPRSIKIGLYVLLAAIIAGSLYLLAVRGDALLGDLAAVAALICG